MSESERKQLAVVHWLLKNCPKFSDYPATKQRQVLRRIAPKSVAELLA